MTEIERIKQEGWLPEDFWKAETICDYYVSEEQKKVWAICLDLYKEFTRVCDENGLKHWAAFGTALGCARHGGFIPWDDDMDLVMFREDYEKLKKLCNKFRKPYFLQDYTTDREYGYSFMKLRNSNTTSLSDVFVRRLYNQGMFIDIFPLDNAKKEDYSERRQKIYELIMKNSAAMRYDKPNKTEHDKEVVEKFYDPNVTTQEVCKKIDAVAREYENVNCDFISPISLTLYDETKNLWQKDIFDSVVEMDFNGIKVKMPIGWKAMLETNYGKWQEFPPVEKRGAWHNSIFFPEIPYVEYYKKNLGMDLNNTIKMIGGGYKYVRFSSFYATSYRKKEAA